MTAIDQNRMRKTCTLISAFALFIIVAIPVFMVAFWINPMDFKFGSHQVLQDLVLEGYVAADDFSLTDKLAGFVITAMPAGMLVLAAFFIQRLMRLFATGAYITHRSVRFLRGIALSLMAFAPATILADTLLVLALTYDNPPGQRLLSIGIGGEEVIAFLIGALLWMITRAFEVEKERAEEHASIV